MQPFRLPRPYEFNPYITSCGNPTHLRFVRQPDGFKQPEDPRIGREFDDFMVHGTMSPFMLDRWSEEFPQLSSWPRPGPGPQGTGPRLNPAAPEFRPRF
jgi:hypothetical protein